MAPAVGQECCIPIWTSHDGVGSGLGPVCPSCGLRPRIRVYGPAHREGCRELGGQAHGIGGQVIAFPSPTTTGAGTSEARTEALKAQAPSGRDVIRLRDCWRRMPRAEKMWVGLCSSGTFVLAAEQVLSRGHL
jgi:hypothetical protein